MTDDTVTLGIIVAAVLGTVSIVGLILFFASKDPPGPSSADPVTVLEEARSWVGGRPRTILSLQSLYN